MSVFKRRQFPVEIILLCVRWYEGLRSDSWRVDGTYVHVGRECKYL